MNIAEYYTRFAETYDVKNQSSLYLIENELKSFIQTFPLPSKILDAGCGPGVESRHIANTGHHVIGMDVSEGMIKKFRKNVTGGEFLLGDISAIPLLNSSVDGIVCLASILHLTPTETKNTLTEFNRILKPHGRGLLLTMVSERSTSEFYTHQLAVPLGLSPIPFFYSGVDELKLAFSDADLKIRAFKIKDLYPTRPKFALVEFESAPEIASAKHLIYELSNSWRAAPLESAPLDEKNIRDVAEITRLAKIDSLSNAPIPIFSAYRPKSKLKTTVFGGKGYSETESRMSAIFEAYETYCAESDILCFDATESQAKQLDPECLSLKSFGIYEKTTDALAWTWVRRLHDGKPTLAPAFTVSLKPTTAKALQSNTNGLSSDRTFFGAILHGLLEVIERHAFSVALISRAANSLDQSTISDPSANIILEFFKANRLNCEIKDLTDISGVPTYSCTISDHLVADASLINGGYGCHPSPDIALRRALSEALQSRSTVIAGAREDLFLERRHSSEEVKRKKELFKYWYNPTGPKVPMRRLTKHHESFKEGHDLVGLVNCIFNDFRNHCPLIGELFYYQFPSLQGTSVVRVIVENAECFSISESRIGPTIRKLIASAIGNNILKGG